MHPTAKQLPCVCCDPDEARCMRACVCACVVVVVVVVVVVLRVCSRLCPTDTLLSV